MSSTILKTVESLEKELLAFLSQVSAAHPKEFILRIVDGASSHKSKDLEIPENLRLIRLPAYAPELNRWSMFGMICGRKPSPIA